MPKYNHPAGVERFNLMLAIVGDLIHRDEPITVAELAQKFEIEEQDVLKAISTISVSGVKPYAPGDLFDVDFDLLESEGLVKLTFDPVLDDVPKLSARQSSALVAALGLMKQLPGFTESGEVDELIELIKLGSVTNSATPIAINPGTIDADAQIIRQAIAADSQITCEYRNAQGEQRQRTIEPLRLESLDDQWYLRGFCPDRKKVLAFRLDRMRAAKVIDVPISEDAKTAEIPDEIYQPNATDTKVTLRVQPEAFRLVSEFRPEQEPLVQDDGSLVFDIMIADLQILGKVISRFAGSAIVVAPEEARTVVRDYALKALGERGGFDQKVRDEE
ncbi:MAG: helix-turn-helix transcriptional regulator [Micrococcales bacterium]